MSRAEENSPAHEAATAAFLSAADDVEGVRRLYTFGSVARGEATDLGSDIDVLAVVADDANETTDRLRDIAYDVTLTHGPVVEVHTLSTAAFEEQADHPFVRRVREEGIAHE